jgi:hypothetical protein
VARPDHGDAPTLGMQHHVAGGDVALGKDRPHTLAVQQFDDPLADAHPRSGHQSPSTWRATPSPGAARAFALRRYHKRPSSTGRDFDRDAGGALPGTPGYRTSKNGPSARKPVAQAVHLAGERNSTSCGLLIDPS